jgi:hypothetical protein
MENQFDLFANPVALFFFWLLVSGLCGGVAAFVAPPTRRLEFFLLTFFFLGPFGVGFASVAPTRPPKVEDAMAFACRTCGIVQNVVNVEDTPTCYRCGSRFSFSP